MSLTSRTHFLLLSGSLPWKLQTDKRNKKSFFREQERFYKYWDRIHDVYHMYASKNSHLSFDADRVNNNLSYKGSERKQILIFTQTE